MIKMREVGQFTVRNLTTWPGTAVRAVRAVVRPAPAIEPPPYTRCAGCGKAGRDDQQIPDPDQFKPVIDADGNPLPPVAPARPAVDVDAPVEGFIHYGSGDPGAQAARISDDNARRGGYGPDIKLVDAAPVRCSCGRWYHAIKCYSLHRHR